MRKKTILLVLIAIVLLLSLVGCFRRPGPTPPPFVPRMTFDQIQHGAMIGGRLLFSPQHPEVSLLRPGHFVVFQDYTRGWEKTGDDIQRLVTQSRHYGYLYIHSVDAEKVVVDYLIYDEDGTISYHEEDLEISPSSFQSRGPSPLDGISYAPFTERWAGGSPVLEGAFLLTVPMEIPSEEDLLQIRGDETYRSWLFRIQTNANTAYHYPSGVIAVHHQLPHLVFNPTFFHLHSDESKEKFIVVDEDSVMLNSSLKGVHLISENDFILIGSSATPTTRRIADNGEVVNGFIEFDTDSISLQQAVGAMHMDLGGNLAQLIRQYGTQEQKDRLAAIGTPRREFEIFTYEKDIELWKEGPLDLVLHTLLVLHGDVDLRFRLDWDELSSRGHIYLLPEASLILMLRLLEGKDKLTHEMLLYEYKEAFVIGPVEFSVVIPIDFLASLEMPGIELKMGGGPKFDAKVGFSWDVGAKLEWKGWCPLCIPWPRFWADGGEVMDYRLDFEYVKPNLKKIDELTFEAGLRVSPGIWLYEVLHTYFRVPAILVNQFKKVNEDWNYTLDLRSEITLGIGIGLSFLGEKSWEWTPFRHTWNLYKKSADQIDPINVDDPKQTKAPIRTSPALSEKGDRVFVTSNDGFLYAYEYVHRPDNPEVKELWRYNSVTGVPTGEIHMTSPVYYPYGMGFESIAFANFYKIGNQRHHNLIILNHRGEREKVIPLPEMEKPLSLSMGWSKSNTGNVQQTIYVLTERRVLAFHAFSFLKMWEHAYGAEHDKVNTGFVVGSDGTIYVFCAGDLFGLTPEGKMVTDESGRPIIISPAGISSRPHQPSITEDHQLYYLTSRFSIAKRNGLSTDAIQQDRFYASIHTNPVIATDGKVYVAGEGGYLFCLDKDLNILWQFNAGAPIQSTPLIASDGNVYVATTGGKIFGVATKEIIKDGKIVTRAGESFWRYPSLSESAIRDIPGGFQSSPSINPYGVLFIGAEDGRFFSILTETKGLSNAPWPKYAMNNQNTGSWEYIPSSLSVDIQGWTDHYVKQKHKPFELMSTLYGGTPPYSYQWYHNHTILEGQNQENLIIQELEVNHEGIYFVEVRDNSNPHPRVARSREIRLTVNSRDIGERKWTFQHFKWRYMAGERHDEQPDYVMEAVLTNPVLVAGGTILVQPDLDLDALQYYTLGIGEVDGATQFVKSMPIGLDRRSKNDFLVDNSGGYPVVYMVSDTGALNAYRVTPDRSPWLDLLWTRPVMAGQTGIHASMAMFGDELLVLSWGNPSQPYVIRSFNKESGNVNWSLEGDTPTAITNLVVSEKGIFYATIESGESTLYCLLLPRDGQSHPTMFWGRILYQTITSPLALDNHSNIYFGDSQGNLYSFNPQGLKNWVFPTESSFPLPPELRAITQSPVIASNGVIYCSNTHGDLLAIQEVDGQPELKAQYRGNGSIVSIVLGKCQSYDYDWVFISTTAGEVIGLLQELDPEWVFQMHGNYGASASMLLHGGTLFVPARDMSGSNRGILYAINVGEKVELDNGPWPKHKRDNQNTSVIH